MFNIRDRVYCTTFDSGIADLNVNIDRFIVCDPAFESTIFDRKAVPSNPSTSGVVYKYNSFSELLMREFDGDLGKLFKFLRNESRLKLILKPGDYGSLFALMLLELTATFGITAEHKATITKFQRIKLLFTGTSQSAIDVFDSSVALINQGYTGTGELYDSANPIDLPFEMIYVMHKWGIISSSDISAKLTTLSTRLVTHYISNVIENAKYVLAKDQTVIREHLGDSGITTLDSALSAITNNTFLRNLFFSSDLVVKNADHLNELIVFTRACIAAEPDDDVVAELAEFNLYVDLMNTNDIAALDGKLYQFVSIGYISNNQDKFNGLLMMSCS